jgi:hypothetical protein
MAVIVGSERGERAFADPRTRRRRNGILEILQMDGFTAALAEYFADCLPG